MLLTFRIETYHSPRSASIHLLQPKRISAKCTVSLGHERSLNQIVFNSEGDLLFSASKDSVVNAWYTSNGERLGTYGGIKGGDGHNGSVWTVAVDCKLNLLSRILLDL